MHVLWRRGVAWRKHGSNCREVSIFIVRDACDFYNDGCILIQQRNDGVGSGHGLLQPLVVFIQLLKKEKEKRKKKTEAIYPVYTT